MKTYSEKLRDPKWQKKRLEILERDNFSCQVCKDDKTELHIHHKKYGYENPWENESDDLITCCKYCHKLLSELQIDKFDISEIIKKDNFYIVLGYNIENKKRANLYFINEDDILINFIEFGDSTYESLIDLFSKSTSFFNKLK